jgi:DNA invertase Pin-like site-specific DNA recombinase
VREKKINCVIVKDLSRLSRNYIEAGQYLDQMFIEYDVRFISLELPTLDSYKNPEQMNSIIVPLQNVINDDFCRQTSIKIRSVFDAKRRNGDFIGGFGPYGYLKDPKDKHHLVVDENAKKIVQDIFHWYVYEGLSKTGIAFKLNELGIPNPSEYKKIIGLKYYNSNKVDSLWSYVTIAGMLKNEMYLGHMVQGKYRVKSYKVHKQIRTPENEWYIVRNTHEPIIDEDTFEKARQRQLKDTRVAPNKTSVYIWSGILKCRDCKCCMIRNFVSESAIYYHCATYRKKSKTACTKHTIRVDRLENAVLVALQKQIALVASMADIVDTINNCSSVNTKSKRIDDLLESHRRDLEKQHSLLDDCYLDWKSGDLSRSQFLRVREKAEEQIVKIENAIKKLQHEQATLENGVNSQNSFLKIFLQHKNIQELDRQILVDLVDVIYVHEGGEITIEYKFQDQLELVQDYINNNKS